jgi:hypothetical protein
MNRLLGLAFLLLLLPARQSIAGPADDAWNSFLAGDFSRVAGITQSKGEDSTLTPRERSRIYLALGCSEAMRNREAASINAFQRSLTLDPSIADSGLDLPPPVLNILDPMLKSRRSALLIEPISQPVKSQPVLHDTVWVTRSVPLESAKVWRSLAFPGWGHLSNGDRVGWWFAGSEAAALAGFVIALNSTIQARDDYLGERSNPGIDNAYQRYNRNYKTTWGFGLLASGIYLACQWDMFTSNSPVKLTFEGRKYPSVGLSLRM